MQSQYDRTSVFRSEEDNTTSLSDYTALPRALITLTCFSHRPHHWTSSAPTWQHPRTAGDRRGKETIPATALMEGVFPLIPTPTIITRQGLLHLGTSFQIERQHVFGFTSYWFS